MKPVKSKRLKPKLKQAIFGVIVLLFVAGLVTVLTRFQTKPEISHAAYNGGSTWEQPPQIVRAAWYFAWFYENTQDDTHQANRGMDWGHWSPYVPTISQKITNDRIAAGNNTPYSYGSDNPEVYKKHIQNLIHGKFDVALYSWRGNYPNIGKYDRGGCKYDLGVNPDGSGKGYGVNEFGKRLPGDCLLGRILDESRGTSLKWAVENEFENYEGATATLAKTKEDLQFMQEHFFNRSAYFHIPGKPDGNPNGATINKPVVTIWTDKSAQCEMNARWAQAQADTGIDIYLNTRITNYQTYQTCPKQPEMWFEWHAKGTLTGRTLTASSGQKLSDSIRPGFWDPIDNEYNTDADHVNNDLGDQYGKYTRRDPTSWDAEVKRQVNSGAKWQFTETFNDWGEGHSVEPAIRCSARNVADNPDLMKLVPGSDPPRYIVDPDNPDGKRLERTQRCPPLLGGWGQGTTLAGTAPASEHGFYLDVLHNNPPPRGGGDTTNPNPPGSVDTLFSCTPTPRVTITWNGSTDPGTPSTGVDLYEVYRGTTKLSDVNHTGTGQHTYVHSGAPFTAGTNYNYRIRAKDSAGNYSAFAVEPETAIACADTTRPSDVSGLNGTYSTDPQANFDFTWNRATDNVAVDYYRLYRNGVELPNNVTQPSSGNISYQFTPFLTPNPGTYNFQVKAVDTSANYSANFSNNEPVPVPDTEPPDAPDNFQAVHETTPTIRNRLAWQKPTDNVAVAGYRIFRQDGTGPTNLIATINNGDTLTYSDTAAASLATGNHTYSIRAFDTDTAAPVPTPNVSAPATDTIAIADTTAPAPAPTLSAYTLQTSPQKVTFTIGIPLPTDPNGVTYKLYQGAGATPTLRQSNITLNASRQFEYSPATSLAQGTYNFRITAIDGASTPNETAYSAALQVVVPDTTAPSPVPSIKSYTLLSSPQKITFELNTPVPTDSNGVTYRLYQGTNCSSTPKLTGVTLNTQSKFDYSPSPMLGAGNYEFHIIAVDGVTPTPNQTACSTGHTVAIPDTTKPNVITTLTGTTLTSPDRVRLLWSNPGDPFGLGVTGYRIERIDPDGVVQANLGSTTAPTTTYDDTSVLDKIGNYIYKVYARDAAGNESNESNPDVTVNKTDTEDPTPPAGLNATYQPNPNRIELTWGAATDNIAVDHYEVWRGSTLVSGSVTAESYTDTTALSPGTYTYTVKAVDAAGNTSDPSAGDGAEVPEPAPNPPTAPTGVSATYQTSPKQINLTWTGSTDSDGSVARYEIHRDGVKVKEVNHPTTSTFDNEAASLTAGTHNYVIYAVDNSSTYSDASSPPAPVNVPDTEAPPTPTGLQVLRQTSPSIRNRLTWTAPSSVVLADIHHYEVYRDGTALSNRIAANVGKNATSYLDTSAAGQVPGTHTYTVIAVDAATPTQNKSAHQSPAASVIVPDITPPEAVDDLLATVQTSPNQVELSWSAPFDNVGVVAYEISRTDPDGTIHATLGTTTGTNFNDTDSLDPGNYTYSVVAKDAAENKSAPSNVVTVVTGDNVKPTPPAEFSATFHSDPYRVDLSWQPSTDIGAGIKEYLIYRDGIIMASTEGTTYSDSSVLSYGDHIYHVVAVDRATPENTSEPSNTSTVAAPDIFAPTAPTNVEGNYQTSPEQINLTWSPSSDPGVGVDHYEVYRDGEQVGTTTGTNLVDSGPFQVGEYRYVVYAVDGADPENTSAASSEVAVSIPDTEKPTPPSNLNAEFSSEPTDSVTLSWESSSDNVDIKEYVVRRGNVVLATVTAPTLTFTDVNVEPDATYTYTVTATDTAQPTPNVSDASDEATITIPGVDTQSPTAPTDLSANYSAASNQTVLNWQPSTDNVEVIGYSIVMDGLEIATTSGTSFTHNSYLAPGNHIYKVYAYDARDNSSAESNAATITVPEEDRGAVRGTVTIQPSIKPGTQKIVYLVDERVVSTEAKEPYSTVIDTTELSNGEHCLTTKTTVNTKESATKDCSFIVDNRKGTDRLLPLRTRDRVLFGLALGAPILAGGFYVFYYRRHHQ